MSLNPCACYYIPMYFLKDIGASDNSLQVWFNDILKLMLLRGAMVVSDQNKIIHDNQLIPVQEKFFLFIINFNAFMMYFRDYMYLLEKGHQFILWVVLEGDQLLCEKYTGPKLRDLAFYVKEMESIRIRPVSNYCREVLVSKGFRVDSVLPNMVGSDKFDPNHRPNYKTTPFVFLCVCANTERKNIPMLLRAFEEEFGEDEGVVLRIRTSDIDASNLPSHITVLPKTDSMRALYKTAHAFVLPSEVEGFGMPVLESLLNGVPTVVPFHSGMKDFVNESNSLPVEYRTKYNTYRSETNIFGNVYDVDEADLRRQMRNMIHAAPRLSGTIDRASLVNRYANPDVFMRNYEPNKNGPTSQT